MRVWAAVLVGFVAAWALALGQTCPTVCVIIPEEDGCVVPRPVPDPACETAIIRAFLSYGFHVVEQQYKRPESKAVTGAYLEGGMEYKVLIHKAEEGGYRAEVPALPGCFSQGETVEEALKNVREAIEAHLQALREEGQGIPGEGEVLLARVEV